MINTPQAITLGRFFNDILRKILCTGYASSEQFICQYTRKGIILVSSVTTTPATVITKQVDVLLSKNQVLCNVNNC